jgi:RNA polymerase sigma factor (sigma-70 family)
MWIEEIAKYHDDWLRVLESFGADYYAEDIVQEMYITLMRRNEPEKYIIKGKLYFPYIYVTLRNSYLNYLKKKNKVYKVDIDEIQIETTIDDAEDKHEFHEFSNKIRDLLGREHWYYERIYDIYTSPENPSFRTMAKDTKISFMTIYNDFKKIKELIDKEHLKQDWKEL